MPYGSWPSPITAELVASRSTAYDAVQMTDRAVYWLEGRPWEDGRTVVVQWTAQEGRVDAVPPGFNVGTRVHEYGGGAYLVAGTTLLVSRLDDQRLYRLDEGRPPRPITPAPAIPATIRYADARLTADRRLLICVRERHQEGEVINELAALPSDGSAAPWVVAGGRDFYAAPRPSPDGRRLAWVTWDRPSMPWDGTDLWVADLTADGRLGPARHVAGGPAESIVQPEWHPDGTLHFLSDRSGWWNLYRHRDDRAEALLPMQAEFADAPWELDYATYAFLADGRLACRYRQDGTDHLALFDPRTGRLEELRLPFTSIKPYLGAVNDRVALIGASPTHHQTVATVDLASGRVQELASPDNAVDPGYLSALPRPRHADRPCGRRLWRRPLHEQGKKQEALDAAAAVYIDRFERLEADIGAENPALLTDLERRISSRVRDKINAGAPVAELQAEVTAIKQLLPEAEKALGGSGSTTY